MNKLYIYNSLTREKQLFIPIVPYEAKMYVCGMTVYDYCHLGHARVMVVFDIIQKWLRQLGYRVTYVRNITDIDDKIIQRAQINKENISALTQRFIKYMHEDEAALGIDRPDIEPRATAYVEKMIEMISQLQSNGYAYQAADGDVNFKVRQFKSYGKLSGKTIDHLRAGERVAANQAKSDPLDFVLWKKAKWDEPDEVKWASPWGEGRPGWHIECSTMSSALLDVPFDIHGGGQDLQFPHHENEIAQSEGACDKHFVNYWIHNGYVQIDNEKMAKSVGNFLTIRDVMRHFDPEVIRFFIARAHYRSPLNYSDTHLKEAQKSLTRLYTTLKEVPPQEDKVIDMENRYAIRFHDAMNDDFNTALAISVLFELASQVHREKSSVLASILKNLANTLGFLQRDPIAFLQKTSNINTNTTLLTPNEIDAKIAARQIAKQSKNFTLSDEIRAELLDAGIVLEDMPNNITQWRRQ